MSTPINFDKDDAGRGPQAGAAYAEAHPNAPQGAPQAGFVPGQVGARIDTGAPSQARLPQRLGDDGKNTKIGFGRLFGVELRKMIDTRAGKWLLITMGLLIAIASIAVMIGSKESPPEFSNFVGAAGIPMGFLLPILGILAVTSEWSQRTALVSFTLEPRRPRVILAKWAAALALGALSIAFAYAIGALTTFIATFVSGKDAVWSLGWGAVGGNVLAQLVAVSIGIAFGLLFQNTPAAICSYLFIPMLVTIIMSFGKTMQKVGEWIDLNQTTQPLYSGTMTTEGWKHFVVSHLVWLVLPMVLGFIRLNRREVKSS